MSGLGGKPSRKQTLTLALSIRWERELTELATLGDRQSMPVGLGALSNESVLAISGRDGHPYAIGTACPISGQAFRVAVNNV